MKYIDVKFTEYGMTYTYKAEDPNFLVGDYAVVHNQATNSVDVVEVINIHEEFKENPRINYTWVVQRVDFTMYQHRCNEDCLEADNPTKERL